MTEHRRTSNEGDLAGNRLNREDFLRRTEFLRCIPYIPLRCSLESRMEQVGRVLTEYVPYSNFYGRHIL